MKLCNFKNFLDAVKSFTGKELDDAIRLLKTEGKDIESIEELFTNNNGELFELLPDGTIIKINLYIATKEVGNYFNLDEFDLDELYKYHIYQCSTISNMFQNNRKHRYKINNRDDGTFYYTFADQSGDIKKIDENQKLNICKNCLKKYSNCNDVKKFDLKKFYNKNNFSFFIENDFEQGEDAKPNVYLPEWNKISKKYKEMKKYTCENCGYKPKNNQEKKFIHTHHQNGDKQNNTNDNLTVLCVECHAKVDNYHARMKSSNSYKEFMSKYPK